MTRKQAKKALGPLELILFGVGVIIGAGIFATIGTALQAIRFVPEQGRRSYFLLPSRCCLRVCSAVLRRICFSCPISGSAYT